MLQFLLTHPGPVCLEREQEINQDHFRNPYTDYKPIQYLYFIPSVLWSSAATYTDMDILYL